ncbi:Ank_2 domain-containing protein [Cephalotus follicularis]|uniref:Ank_2 domain-containing protein n=1 Tax=Cephalotus follicularis TaxID=3775 RepID=A0A1Q3D7X8_CEPFO|nr:Ank_2 domain-containing protein [Cephalotus follicularis]
MDKPCPADSISIKEKFIHAKYAEKLFVRKPKDSQYIHSVTEQIWEAVRANDRKVVYHHIVNSEADVNAVYEKASSSSLTLAKVMLMQERTSLDHSSSCLAGYSLDQSSISSLTMAGVNEVQSVEDLDGCTLLHLACETADIGMLELLLQYAANICATDSRGQTPLHHCILRGRAIFARLLLSR